LVIGNQGYSDTIGPTRNPYDAAMVGKALVTLS
jgi:hypothetical protein